MFDQFDQIEGDYDQLDQISGQFVNQAQVVQQMLEELLTRMSRLENGDWMSRGAKAFFGEANEIIKSKTVPSTGSAPAVCDLADAQLEQ